MKYSLPKGESEETLLSYLQEYHQVYRQGGASEQLVLNYLMSDFKRFLHTLDLIPRASGKLLEIGANPYFTTQLIDRFLDYDIHCTNYFGKTDGGDGEQTLLNESGEKRSFKYEHCNVEHDELPYPNDYFDVILYCEVMEHLTMDPHAVLLKLRQKLKPDGCLILTTPNAVRLTNVTKMLFGANVFNFYSAAGIYGRHNREYTLDEVQKLLTHSGFELEKKYTADVTHHCFPRPWSMRWLFDRSVTLAIRGLRRFVPYPDKESVHLGEYIFVRALKSGEPETRKPAWLYSSYPPDEVV